VFEEEVLRMNRETRLERDETIVVVDSSRRRRNLILALLVGSLVLALAWFFFVRSDEPPAGQAAKGAAAAGEGRRGGQVPTVTVVVPGRSQVANIITVSGALAARRDQPIGAAGQGGRVNSVLVDAGTWVRAGQVLATVDRSVQVQTTAQLAAAVEAARASAALAQNEYDRSAGQVDRRFGSRRRSSMPLAPVLAFSTSVHLPAA
jgi:multidrug efflux pump subunit AcrA (membrane-fusion protein)